EAAAAAHHVEPPPAGHVIAAVHVPAGVAGIACARESDRQRAAHRAAWNPAPGAEQHVVRGVKRRRRAGGSERGTLGTEEADHRVLPRGGIARLDAAHAELGLDDVEAVLHPAGSPGARDGEIAVDGERLDPYGNGRSPGVTVTVSAVTSGGRMQRKPASIHQPGRPSPPEGWSGPTPSTVTARG